MDHHIFRDHHPAQNDLARLVHRLYFCFRLFWRIISEKRMRTDDDPLEFPGRTGTEPHRLLRQHIRQDFRTGDLLRLISLRPDLYGILRVRLFFRRLHTVFKRRRRKFQNRSLSGGICLQFLKYTVRNSCIRYSDHSVFHRFCTIFRQNCHLQPASVRSFLKGCHSVFLSVGISLIHFLHPVNQLLQDSMSLILRISPKSIFHLTAIPS